MSADHTTRQGCAPYPYAGAGLAVTRQCGKCGKRQLQGKGWKQHRILGGICPACAEAGSKGANRARGAFSGGCEGVGMGGPKKTPIKPQIAPSPAGGGDDD